MEKNIMDDFLGFIDEATSPYTTVRAMEKRLQAAGFNQLQMNDAWSFAGTDKYYVMPAPTLLVAFTLPAEMHFADSFRIIASHDDTPGFRVKPKGEMKTYNYLKLNTEVYGGPIYSTWMDRMLSLSGTVSLKGESPMKPRQEIIDFEKPMLTIPNLAIHFNREMNKGVALNPQKDLLPILGIMEEGLSKDDYLMNLIAEKLEVDKSEILDFELHVYLREPGVLLGKDAQLISAPRLDNLAMVYGSMEALMNARHKKGINMGVCFDHEEVGSGTMQGAESAMLHVIAERILIAFNRTREQFYRTLTDSFMISADAAHAAHPNATEATDPTNTVLINQGVTIKYSAKKSYATDSESAAIFKSLCEIAQVPCQTFTIRSDIAGGRSLGPIATTGFPVRSVDVGLPMLAMHSVRELVGVKDFLDMMKVFEVFYCL